MRCAGRRLVLRLAAATFAGGASGWLHEVLAMGVHPVKPGVHRIRGTVTVNGKPAREGQIVQAGDTVVTGPGSEVVYVIGEDAFLQRADTRASFASAGAKAFARVVAGAVLMVFGKGERNIAVPQATIGIRGTGCYIEAAEDRTYFCLCYGEVEVRPQGGEPLSYETTHHENPLWLERDSASGAPVINHTDAELTMLENLVGRWPPFSSFDTPTY